MKIHGSAGRGQRRGGWRRATVAGLAGLGIGELTAAAQGRSLIDGVGRAVVDWSPRALVDLTVELLGSRDKTAIRIGVGVAAAGSVTGLARLPETIRTPAVTGLAAATAGLAMRRNPQSKLAFTSAATAAAVATGVSLRRGRSSLRCDAALAVAGGSLLAAARLLLSRRRRLHRQLIQAPGRLWGDGALPDDGFDEQPGRSPIITPADRFYVTDVNLGAPIVDPDHWRLSITGLVARPLQLSLSELAADAEEFDAVMVCIHNPVGGSRVGNGRWLGVPLRTVLERADPSAHATTLVTRAVDGFAVSLPIEPLMSGDWNGYVAVGLNGEPLPAEHGYPARVFVPGIYGQYTGAKWLHELELVAGPHSDYWSPRGWPHQPARVQPHARIDIPSRATPPAGGTVAVAGVAWAPPHGLADVEVRTGDGPWQAAELASEVGPLSWRRWRTALDLAPGTHTIQARAVSRSGEIQDGRERPPFPLGAGGWHTITVHVSP